MKNSSLFIASRFFSSTFKIFTFLILSGLAVNLSASNLPLDVSSSPLPLNTGDVISLNFDYGTAQIPVQNQTQISLTYDYSGYKITNPQAIQLNFSTTSYCQDCTGEVSVNDDNNQLNIVVKAPNGQVISGSGTLVVAEGIVIELDDPETKKANPNGPIINVFPNPATKAINIQGGGNGEEVSFFSMEGKLVKKALLTGEKTKIPVTDLAKGIYILKGNINNQVFSKQILIK